MEEEEAIYGEDIQEGENSDNDEGGLQFRICNVPFGSPEKHNEEKRKGTVVGLVLSYNQPTEV